VEIFFWGVFIGALIGQFTGTIVSGRGYEQSNFRSYLRGASSIMFVFFILAAAVSILSFFGVR